MTKLFLAIPLAFVYLTGAASAQDDISLDTMAKRKSVQIFADCVVKRHLEGARQFVLSGSGSGGSEAAKILDSECIGAATADVGGMGGIVTLQAPRNEIRFAVAEALVHRDLRNFDPNEIAKAAPLPQSTLNSALYAIKDSAKLSENERQERILQLERARSRDEALVALTNYGECVVRKNPVGARNLLESRVNGPEEGDAFQAMMPAFSACLDKGKDFKSDRNLLRGTIALNYYRLALAPKLPQPEAPK
ncbi:MAG TPA: hypothetical protein VNS53_02650 [Sphingomicrobium sp.]|jgi:hypothetical protein|nr:hypothetical protein [Sphingomicrobium sp.]